MSRVIAAAIGLALMAAAPASAGTPGATVSLGSSKGLEYLKGTYNDVVAQTSQAVDCDGGSEATGGGGALTGSTASTYLNESFPTQPGPTGWTVEGSASSAQTMTGFAICAPVATEVSTSSNDVSAGVSSTFDAFCGSSDQSVTGGGVEASNVGVLISATYPPDLQTDNWFSLAKNTADTERVVYSHAICSAAFSVRYRDSDVVKVKPGKTVTASAMCKSNEAVLGGGFVPYFDGLPAPGGWASVSRPRDSKKDPKKVPDDGWTATYRSESKVTHRLVVEAVCKAGNAPT